MIEKGFVFTLKIPVVDWKRNDVIPSYIFCTTLSVFLAAGLLNIKLWSQTKRQTSTSAINLFFAMAEFFIIAVSTDFYVQFSQGLRGGGGGGGHRPLIWKLKELLSKWCSPPLWISSKVSPRSLFQDIFTFWSFFRYARSFNFSDLLAQSL